ncbi:hypothetical protein [Sandarakinorhabdus sp.]|uniref:hypothetical protein n=1 Tax=Sandarakinorhabdus sp. TaxID=1916663 RepID=UPI003F6F5508
MHLRFNCDGPSFSAGFSRGIDRAFTGKGARWAAFAQAFSDELGSNWGGGPGGRSRAGPRRGRRYAITNAGRAALDDAKAQKIERL